MPPRPANALPPLDLRGDSYRDLLLEIEKRSAPEFLAICARKINGLAVNAYDVCLQKKFGRSLDGLLKNKIFSYLGDEVGVKARQGDVLGVSAGPLEDWSSKRPAIIFLA